ncbi:MAG: BlaI/MecI/CopY family transcriptional regulator, partial [Planctomycetaceae bacterium]
SKKPSEIRLGRLELQIMSVVWDKGTATVHDVKEALTRGRKPAYSTILTMMRKLEAKGYLEHDVADRTFVYRATISREQARHSMLGDLLERVFEGSPSLLISSLVEQNHITEDELREIRKLIAERKRQNE